MNKTLRLLLVEDSENDEVLLLHELSRGPYEIVHERVDNPVAMKAALEKKEWDLVVCDYAMPHFSAPEALALLRRNNLDLPFLIVSGTIGEETAVEAMKAGAHDYLMKGKLMRLLPAIERELREAKMRKLKAQAEIDLYQSEEKFRFMFEHNPVPMWVMDTHTQQFLEVNQAAVSRFGYSRNEFLRMKLSDLNETGPVPIEIPTSTGHRSVIEKKLKINNGEIIEAELHSDALELNEHEVQLVIVQDITHRKQIERDLIQARETALEVSRLKSEFLANVSHEIRTPLNGIVGATGFLLQSVKSRPDKEWLEVVRVSGEALVSIVNQVLDFSELESKQMKLEEKEFNMEELLKNVTGAFASVANKKGIQMKRSWDPKLPAFVIGDSRRLQQVLANLIDNAVKFTPEGTIFFRVETPSENDEQVTLKFSIQDTGIGIPDHMKGRLFRAFSQVDGSMTRAFGGTGLGLAICEKFITLMGGEMGVHSELGKGSIFWFQVPFSKSPSSQQKDSDPPRFKLNLAQTV